MKGANIFAISLYSVGMSPSVRVTRHCGLSHRWPPRGGDAAWYVDGWRLLIEVVGHLEDDLHVVAGARASDTTVKVSTAGGGDEVVVLAGPELQASRGRTERSECYCCLQLSLRFITDCHDPWFTVCNSAAFIFFFADIIDDISLPSRRPGPPAILGTHYIDLIVLPGKISLVHIHDMVCVVYPKYRIGRIPMDCMNFDSSH